MVQEVVKSWLGKLDTMLELDDEIAVDSVEELKAKYDEFVKENFPEVQTETTILKEKKKNMKSCENCKCGYWQMRDN